MQPSAARPKATEGDQHRAEAAETGRSALAVQTADWKTFTDAVDAVLLDPAPAPSAAGTSVPASVTTGDDQ